MYYVRENSCMSFFSLALFFLFFPLSFIYVLLLFYPNGNKRGITTYDRVLTTNTLTEYQMHTRTKQFCKHTHTRPLLRYLCASQKTKFANVKCSYHTRALGHSIETERARAARPHTMHISRIAQMPCMFICSPSRFISLSHMHLWECFAVYLLITRTNCGTASICFYPGNKKTTQNHWILFDTHWICLVRDARAYNTKKKRLDFISVLTTAVRHVWRISS